MALAAVLLLKTIAGAHQSIAPLGPGTEILDAKVKAFLDGARHEWREQNVPYEDGQILYELIVQNGFKNILEIGTSTGHSTIWLAWAASKNSCAISKTMHIPYGPLHWICRVMVSLMSHAALLLT